jgi:hypothetical protein
MDTGDVTAGGNNAALAATNNNRFVAQIGIVELFDRCKKSIAVDMRDRQAFKLVMH